MNVNAIKRFAVDTTIEQGELVTLSVNPHGEGVEVPPHLVGPALVDLILGLDMTPPISDLWIDDSGVIGTLSFDGKPFTCKIPWGSVHVIRDLKSAMLFAGPRPSEAADVG